MNWKRGFRRIAFVLAGVAAVVFAGLSVVVVLSIHSNAENNLRWEQEKYAELHEPIETLPNGFILDLGMEEISKLREAGFSNKGIQDYAENQTANLKAEQISAKKDILKEEKGFWVNLSKGGLVGMCSIGGLFGGIIGFVIVWLIYKFLEWLAFGFRNDTD